MPAHRAAAVLLAAVAVTGCGQPTVADDALRPAAPSGAADCPSGSDGADMLVDYVPFVRHGGLQYVGWGSAASPVAPDQVGRQVGTVTCRLSDTAYDPDRQAQDGDAAFLPVGAPLHALKGAAPAVRLVARDGDTWRLYELDDDPAARRGGDLLDLRDVVRVSLVGGDSADEVVRSINDPDEVARVAEAVAEAPTIDRGEQASRVRGPQWFVRFDLAGGPPVQRAWYPEGRWLFPRIASPDALSEALLR